MPSGSGKAASSTLGLADDASAAKKTADKALDAADDVADAKKAQRAALGEGATPSKVSTPEAPRKIPNDQLNAPPPSRGSTPIGSDNKPVELHHRGQAPDSPLDEMTSTDHRGAGNFKKNHANTGQEPSQIDRKTWRNDQRNYWKNEWDSGRFDDM